MTCGEETEKLCLNAIQPWKDRIVFQEVRNVFPQVKALNQMINQTNTEYLIPLDSDIVLNNDAFERICWAIDKFSHDTAWHSILFKLWDTLTEKEILALKILRTEIMKKHLFKDVATPDVEHFTRLTNSGHTCIDKMLSKPPIGRHIVQGKHFCYHKYKDIYQTLRTHKKEWDPAVFMGGETILEKSENHFNYFLNKYLITDNEDYLWAITGMIDGITSKYFSSSKNLNTKFECDCHEGIMNYLNWRTKIKYDLIC